MQSHCLKHQEKVATARCGACSIPLCELCAQPYQDGVYCSDRCHQSVQEGQARMAKMAAEEEALRKRRQTQAALKMIFYVVAFCLLFFGWDYLPEGFTGWVEGMWKSVTDAFAKGK